MGKKVKESEDYSELTLKRFAIIGNIGKGAFGSVKAIEDKRSKIKYALKFINKNHCIEEKATSLIFKERMMLQKLSHPFIISIRYAFQDDDYLFIVLDLAVGGDLRYNMSKNAFFDEHTLVVYTAEISSAISYMHSKLIIHRDLKPENLLVDENGHILLTDLNLATSLERRRPTSQSGTLDYMAPEMHLSKPYGYSIDWWALGTILYECIYRRLPFGGGKSAGEVAENSRVAPLIFPSLNYQKIQVGNSKERIDFVSGCLQRDIKLRLGSANHGQGFDSQVKAHPYLSRINWTDLLEKKVLSNYKPVIEKDTLNVSQNVLIEEMLGGNENLQYKPRKKKQDPNDPTRKMSFVEKINNSLTSLFQSRSKSTNLSNHNISGSQFPKEKPKSRKQLEKDQMDELYIPYDWELPNQKHMRLPEDTKKSSITPKVTGERARAGTTTRAISNAPEEKILPKSESSPDLTSQHHEGDSAFIPRTALKRSPLREATSALEGGTQVINEATSAIVL